MKEETAVKLTAALNNNTEALNLVVATADKWGEKIADGLDRYLPAFKMRFSVICSALETTVNLAAGRRVLALPSFMKES